MRNTYLQGVTNDSSVVFDCRDGCLHSYRCKCKSAYSLQEAIGRGSEQLQVFQSASIETIAASFLLSLRTQGRTEIVQMASNPKYSFAEYDTLLGRFAEAIRYKNNQVIQIGVKFSFTNW